MNLSSIPPIITKSLSRTLQKNVADVTVSQLCWYSYRIASIKEINPIHNANECKQKSRT